MRKDILNMDIDNPILVRNSKLKALEDAQELFMEVLGDYAKDRDLSTEEIEEIKDLIVKAYLEKKIIYYLEHKTSVFSNYFNHLTESILQDFYRGDEEKTYTKFFYLKHSKQLLTNEQY